MQRISLISPAFGGKVSQHFRLLTSPPHTVDQSAPLCWPHGLLSSATACTVTCCTHHHYHYCRECNSSPFISCDVAYVDSYRVSYTRRPKDDMKRVEILLYLRYPYYGWNPLLRHS